MIDPSSIRIVYTIERKPPDVNQGIRHSVQRSNRVRLKADAVVLLDRIAAAHGAEMSDKMQLQIAEMRMRLAPPTGVKAPIVHTRFTK